MVESQILAGLRCGFALSDLRLLSVPEVLAFCDMMAPPDEGAPRKATQADIDRLLG